MIISFRRDNENNFIDPLAPKVEKVLSTLYRTLYDRVDNKAIAEFSTWVKENVPCTIKYEIDYGDIFIVELEIEEDNMLLFFLKYSELLNAS